MVDHGCLVPCSRLNTAAVCYSQRVSCYEGTAASHGLGGATTSINMIVLANFLRLLATLVVGLLFGAICAWFMNAIADEDAMGLFTGKTSERLLMLLATTLWAFGLGQGEEGNELVPMGFAPGSMFQPELLVIVTGLVDAVP